MLAAHETAPPDDDEAEVETLLQRVSDALMPEYRREAMSQLKEMLVDNPKAGHLAPPESSSTACCCVCQCLL